MFTDQSPFNLFHPPDKAIALGLIIVKRSLPLEVQAAAENHGVEDDELSVAYTLNHP